MKGSALGTAQFSEALDAARPQHRGKVQAVIGLNVQIGGLVAAIGDAIEIETPDGRLHAEVVALDAGHLVCLPYGDLHGVRLEHQPR